MKFTRIQIAIIVLLFLFFFVDALQIEYSAYHVQPGSSRADRFLSTAAAADDTLNKSFKLRYLAYECAGLFNRITGRRHLDGMYRLNNGHLVSVGRFSDISETFDAIMEFSDFCAKKKLPFLYVNLPKKYARDEDLTMFGVHDRTDQKADLLLQELTQAGVSVLDMRPRLFSHYSDPYDAFFRTDHHWKISAGLFCAQVLSYELEGQYGINLDPEKINDEQLSICTLPDSWMGERGKKTGSSYSGLDDFEVIKPVNETHFHLEIPSRALNLTGDFSIMLDESRYTTDYWEKRYGPSFYYSYLFGNDPIQIIQNADQDTGKILIIRDSFAQSVNPFLAMTANTVVSWDVRYNSDSIRNYIDENDFDVVVVMYSESMINGYRENRFLYDFS